MMPFFVKIGIGRKAVVIDGLYVSFDLIWKVQFPNPSEGVVRTFDGVSFVGNVLISTFTRENSITPQNL